MISHDVPHGFYPTEPNRPNSSVAAVFRRDLGDEIWSAIGLIQLLQLGWHIGVLASRVNRWFF